MANKIKDNIDHDINSVYQVILRSEGGPSKPIYITGYLPEEFVVALTASWSPAFAAGFGNPAAGLASVAGSAVSAGVSAIPGSGGAIGQALTGAGSAMFGNGIEGVKSATGNNLTLQKASGMAYDGPTQLALQIPFIFIAREDSQTQVTDPIKQLLKMVAPTLSEYGYLTPPGPKLAFAGGDGAANVLKTVKNIATQKDKSAQDLISVGGETITLKIGNYLTFSPVVITSVSSSYNTRFDSAGRPIQARVDVSISTYFAVSRKDIDGFFGG